MAEPDPNEHVGPEELPQNASVRLPAEAKSMVRKTNGSNPRALKDITYLFNRHSAALQPGQLVKDEFFTLFESVGALEIMDPKMDSGFIPEGDSFDAEFDVEGTLDGGQVLWVMDQLMCLEIQWLEGYPLSQTLFTCLFVARLLEPGNRAATFRQDTKGGRDDDVNEVLTHRVLHAYCVALIKCLELSMQVIQGQTYYEEEDFVTHLFGRDLLPKTTVEDALELLTEAQHAMDKATDLSTDFREALGERLVFRKTMLHGLGGDPYGWQQMLESTDSVNTSHALSTPTPEVFSSKIQRQLATSTPPRPMLNVSWDDGIKRWRQLTGDILEAYRLTSLEVISDPQCLQRAVWSFASRKPAPTTLPRAILQEQLFHEQGAVATGFGHYELFLVDLRNTVLAGDSLVDPASFQVELTSDPRHLRARLLEGFMEKAFDEYLNLYRMICQNRCRIRRLFTQAIGILDTLESEAAKTDRAIAETPFSPKAKDTMQRSLRPLASWSKLYRLRIMAWTVQMGFETEIYMNDELGSMYWYLSRLTSEQSRLIEHIDHHLAERMKARPAALADCFASKAYLHSEKLMADAACAIASALSTLFFYLQLTGIIPSPKREFSTQQLFYEARMKPYLSVSNDRIPSAVDFENARKALEGRLAAELCAEIDAQIKTGKSLLADLKKIGPEAGKFVGTEEQFKKNVKALETTCVAVAVNTSQLGRLSEKHGEGQLKGVVECTMERRWHDWWTVPVLKEKK